MSLCDYQPIHWNKIMTIGHWPIILQLQDWQRPWCLIWMVPSLARFSNQYWSSKTWNICERLLYLTVRKEIRLFLGFNVQKLTITGEEGLARQACSSQILYLSNSTKITTNTETAMLSRIGYILVHRAGILAYSSFKCEHLNSNINPKKEISCHRKWHIAHNETEFVLTSDF